MTWIPTVFKGLVLSVLMAGPAISASVTVAVASNFLTTSQALETAFEAETGHEVTLVHGSTGRLYAQIVAGAPFDIFLSADMQRPEALLVGGLAVDTRIYAVGALVLVARDAPEDDPAELLIGQRVALANPALAPYGAAAMEVIGSYGLTPDQIQLLMGDNVGQAASIFVTGNADRAFLAAALLPKLDLGITVFEMAGRHMPVRQGAALLDKGAANPVAQAFYDWLAGPTARVIIEAGGYEVPT
ncbi:MAG: molybdate ABC transporter substrate-binding protein [Alphaproteobacteria bacterium]|nr:molybdate ABC transporter substrate-binding protein [Alphaproteobacteria bacterium]